MLFTINEEEGHRRMPHHPETKLWKKDTSQNHNKNTTPAVRKTFSFFRLNFFIFERVRRQNDETSGVDRDGTQDGHSSKRLFPRTLGTF